MQKIEIIFYQKANGSKPAEEFIESLSKSEKKKIYHVVDMLSDRGGDLRMPYSRYLEDGIYELRANASRVLYFFIVRSSAVLTNGFTKKTNKTPRDQIEKAKRYREDYSIRLDKKEGNKNNVE